MSKNTNLSFLTDYITADITNGRIGINNASPAYAFDVTGIARTSTSTYLATASGSVGIGTITPLALLHVGAGSQTAVNLANTKIIIANSGNSGRAALLTLANDSAGNSIEGQFESSGDSAEARIIFGSSTNHPLIFRTNNTERMRISGAGITTIMTNDNVVLKATNVAQAMYIDYRNSAGTRRSYMGFGGDSNSNFDIWNSENGAMVFGTNNTERMRITSGGNVGIGTSSPSYKLHVSGNGYFGSGLTVEGTVNATSFSATAALVTYNVGQFQVTNSYSFTPPNMLTASSTDSEMKMYMVWIWGANTAIYGGVRVWMIAVNGGGTAYTVNTLLSRDVGGGSGLDLTRTSATQLTITSNNIAAIKWVSIMQLNTNT